MAKSADFEKVVVESGREQDRSRSKQIFRGLTSGGAARTSTSFATMGALRDVVFVNSKNISRISQPILKIVTRLGWIVILSGLIFWIAGSVLGWQELLLASSVCIALIIICIGFVLGRVALDVEIELNPIRVVVGDPVAGQVRFANNTSRRTTSVDLELPVGGGLARFKVGALSPGDSGDEVFVVTTERRGVIKVGPPSSVKNDPVGLLVRKVSGETVKELMVYPRTIDIPPFGSGLLRDLEGLTTKEVSPSDLAFHSLRDYVPGDDRRFIHWKSSAKIGQLQIRQFLDTRRSSISVIVDSRPSSYGDSEEYEVAIQVAGSVALRAARDGLASFISIGDLAATSAVPHMILDVLARAQLSESAPTLASKTSQVASRVPDTTMAVLVGGSLSTNQEVLGAGARFGESVRILDLRIDFNSPSSIVANGRTTLVRLHQLRDLPIVVASGGSV